MDATRLPFHSTPFTSGGRYGLSSSNIRRRRLESRQPTSLASPCKFDVSAEIIRSRRSVVPSYADDGHATYYQKTTPRATCGGSSSLEAKKTTKDRGGRHSESKDLKKKLKRVEGLLRSSSSVSTMVFVDEQGEAASFNHHGLVLAETAKRLILQRLEQVKAQETEAKRRRKAEKAVKKAAAAVRGERKGMRMADDSESSSSTSSESSDSDRQVLDMTPRRCRPRGVEAALQLGKGFVEEGTDEEASAKVITINNNNNNNNGGGGGDEVEAGILREGSLGMGISSSHVVGLGGRIEVCMGGKCQRSGAGRLKVELERQVGLQGTVVGCKCMGRCKHGPNVRLRHDCGELLTPSPPISQSHPSSICCVGVGLEDVPSLVSSFLVTNLDPHPLSA